MRVADRMSAAPLTIRPDVSVDEALKMMRANEVRHLPVLSGGRVVGMVTDTELRTAWFASLLDKLTVSDVMVKKPLTIESDDSVYQAARILHHNKLTGLPVMRDGKLVGIITQADILALFLEVMGLLDETSRIDLELPPGASNLHQAHAIIAANGGEVVSVAQLPCASGGRVYSFRLKKADMAPLRQALEQAGHRVLK